MMDLGYELLKGKFDYCKKVTWEDVIDKIDYEANLEPVTSILLYDSSRPAPTIVLQNDYLPGNLKNVFKRTVDDWGVIMVHIYTSFGGGSQTFGRHDDEVNVLIAQSIGRVGYRIDNNKGDFEDVYLDPGDGIIIKKGVFHAPIIGEPRVTLSFSWD